MQFIFRIPSRFMTVFFGFDPCVTIYYEILFRKSEWTFNVKISTNMAILFNVASTRIGVEDRI